MKCVNLRFFSGLSPGYSYCIHGQPVALKQSHRDLDIIMTWDLSWKNHHEYVLSKAYKILGLLQRTFSNFGCTLEKKTLSISLVGSHLMYCSQIWRPQYLRGIQSLENIQRRATKFITNDYTSRYKSRLIKRNKNICLASPQYALHVAMHAIGRRSRWFTHAYKRTHARHAKWRRYI